MSTFTEAAHPRAGDGRFTAVIPNSNGGRIIFGVTDSDGSHGPTEYLPLEAFGNEVSATVDRLRVQLR